VKSGALAQQLEKLGLRAREDFLLHLPLRYEDETALAPPGKAPPATPVYLEARVVRAELAYRPRRGRGASWWCTRCGARCPSRCAFSTSTRAS